MVNEKVKWKHIAYAAVGLVVALALIYLVIARPENNAIAAEKQRLAEVEKKVIEAIATKDYELVKAYLIQLRWQYEPRSAGGIGECDMLRQVWRNKRIEYYKLTGENPDNFMNDDKEGETKGLKQQWKEIIGK
jgi:hypothetical protein